MILKTLKLTNYKCIYDSGEFNIADVTALVGKNESGKSAILQALYKLNPVEESDKEYSDIEEYPRSKYSEYEEEKSDNPATIVSTQWELSPKEVSEIEGIYGKGSLKDTKISISKKYNNTTYYTIKIDEDQILKHLKETSSFDEGTNSAITSTKNLEEYFKLLEDLSVANPEIKAKLSEILKNIPNKNPIRGFIDYVSKILPKFLYFADYYKLPGQVSLDAINQRISQGKNSFEDKVFMALLGLVGTDLKQLQGLTTFEQYIAKLETVSLRLTKEVFEYWTQNRQLEVDFRFDAGRPADSPPFNSGYVFRTRIRNTRHGVTVSFDERSTGFVWFFSFLVYFSQLKRNFGERLVILLDEPGLSLHAKAQADLLRYINEKLAPTYQVIYTTHSPFMIDQEKILNVRTVEDVVKGEEILGTKVGQEILSIDKDTILPLQAALGYEITQTLFISPNTVLVEGPSDLLYLKFFSNELKKLGRTYLNSKWSIAPCGGIDKIASFVILFNSQKLNLAVVADYHKGDKKKLESLTEKKLLQSGHVFPINGILNKAEADIEDMLGAKLYINLVNQCYELRDGTMIKLPEEDVRVVEYVENKFRVMPGSIKEFDHYEPSEHLTICNSDQKKELDFSEALNNFEKLFVDLNKLI